MLDRKSNYTDYKLVKKSDIKYNRNSQTYECINRSSQECDRLLDRKLKSSPVAIIAYYLIYLATVIVREHNDKQTDINNKICLTEELLFKLTGSNREIIKIYFEEHQDYIDRLNSKHNLTEENNNNKGKDFDFKEFLQINN